MARVNRAKHVSADGAGVRPWSVYLLRCADGTLYAGATSDMDKRLVAHGKGRVKYTRGRLPVLLAYVEPVGGKGAALSREAAIKRLRRKQKEALCVQCKIELAPRAIDD